MQKMLPPEFENMEGRVVSQDTTQQGEHFWEGWAGYLCLVESKIILSLSRDDSNLCVGSFPYF